MTDTPPPVQVSAHGLRAARESLSMLRATETQPEHASLAAAVLGGRIIELCDELAQFSEEPGRLTCTYLTPAHRAAASQIASWMQAAGLDTSIDAVGNVIGRLP